MSAITLDASAQIGIAAVWVLTIALAYLRGTITEIDRQNAWMAGHIAWLESLPAADDSDEPGPAA